MISQTLNDTKVYPLSGNDSLLIRAGRVFDGKKISKNLDVLLAGGRIARVGAPGSFDAADAEILDAREKFLMPGLIESHVHLSGMQTSDPYKRYFEPETTRLVRGLRHAEELLSRGFTTVKDMGGKGKGVELNDIRRKGLFVGPHILSAHEAITPTFGHFDWPVLPFEFVRDTRLRGTIADGPEACRQAVRLMFREGADFIKICTSATPVQFSDVDEKIKPCYSVEEIRALCDEAHAHGKLVCSHAVDHIGICNAIAGGVDIVEHCFHDSERHPEILELLLENDVAIIPTVSLLKWKSEMQEKKGDIDGARDFANLFERHKRFVKKAHEGGLRMATGTDENGLYGIGRNCEELIYLRDAGIDAVDVLRCATSQAAQISGIDGLTGSVWPSYRADLLLLARDPSADLGVLKDKKNIEAVFLGTE